LAPLYDVIVITAYSHSCRKWISGFPEGQIYNLKLDVKYCNILSFVEASMRGAQDEKHPPWKNGTYGQRTRLWGNPDSAPPLGGGLLSDPRLCFRFLRQYPGIVPDPGIEHAHEMEELIQIYSDDSPLTNEERTDIERARTELGATWCHRCEYCQPCPEGIPISTVLTAQSMTRRMPFEKATSMLGGAMAKTADCSECGTCEGRCPYDLPIRELLKTRQEQYSWFRENRVWA
jgi:ferredoxin